MARKRTALEIDAEIAKLQEERDAARVAEKGDVVERMKVAIAFYGITATDLGFGLARGKHAAAEGVGRGRTPIRSSNAAAEKRGGSRIKFKDDAGHSWSGFGPKPRWFSDALASGKTLEDLRVA